MALSLLLILGLVVALAVTWKSGWAWLPLLLMAGVLSMSPLLRGWLVVPFLDPAAVARTLAGWPLVPMLVIAFLAFRRRWAWRAPGSHNLIALIVMAWFAAALLGGAGLVGPGDIRAAGIDPGPWSGGPDLSSALRMATALALACGGLGAIAVLGYTLGRTAAWAAATLWRLAGRGTGIYTRRLKLRWDRGDPNFRVAYDSGGKAVPTKVLPLHEAPAPVVMETRMGKVHVPKYSHIEARSEYGTRIHGTIESEGHYVDQLQPTSWWIGRTDSMTSYHVKSDEVAETNRALRWLAPFVEAARRDWRQARQAQDTAREREAAEAAQARAAQAQAAREQATRDEAARRDQARRRGHEAMAALVRQAGLDTSAMWSRYGHDLDGRIAYALAADRNGRGLAVYDQGAKTWTGSWRGATCEIEDGALQIQVDDPEYRRQHLSQRRFTLGERMDKAEQLAWLDRIRLLSAGTV